MPGPGTAARSADHAFGATIRDALDMLASKGYRGSLRVAGARSVQCLQCRRTHDPADVPLHELVRVEGVSDPADEDAVVGLVCPACSARGSVVIAYGPNATPEEAAVLVRLQDRRENGA